MPSHVRTTEQPWSVPVAQTDVPESGRRFDLSPDPQTRDAIAKFAGVDALLRFDAHFDVTPHGAGGLRIVGQISATVSQTCSVTLEPMENQVEETVDLAFLPATTPGVAKAAGEEIDMPFEDPPERLVDGRIDLGAIATEFLVLGIDPYPRKPGKQFHSPDSEAGLGRPFAALAALRKVKPQSGS